MNTSLYRSWHAAAALVLAAGFLAWARVLDRPLGWAIGVDRPFLLWSGWVVLSLYLVLWAYAARKAAHRTRASFEFGRALPLTQLERAQERLSDLRVDAFAGRITDRRSLLQRARQVLTEEKVDRVLAVAVGPAADGAPPHLEVAWRRPLGRLAKWMHSHIYYGFAAAVLVTLHGGLRFSSTMGILLNGLSIAVLGTGFVGLFLWTFGPRWLSTAERDLNLERAYALRAYYADKVGALAAELRPLAPAAVDAALHGAEAEGAALLAALSKSGGAADGVATADGGAAASDDGKASDAVQRGRDLLVLLGQRRHVEVAWRRLAGRRLALNAWRLVHVPLSIALLLVVGIHVFSVLMY